MGKKIKSFFKNLAIGAATITGGIGLGTGTFFLIDSIERAGGDMNGYKMVHRDAHLKEGVHRIVLTDSFYNLFSKRSPALQDYAIESLKEAYRDLNKYNTGIKFDIYTQNDGLLKYGLKKADTIDSKNDIQLNLIKTTEEKDDPDKTVAYSTWNLDKSTRELQYESITMEDKFLFVFFDLNETPEETFVPSNSATYPVIIHETMHCMGFAHRDTPDSIMYPYITLTTPRKLTEADIEILKTYNETYYSKEIETPIIADKKTDEDTMEM